MAKRTTSLLFSLLLWGCMLLNPAAAETLLGHCVGVADGDTCTLLIEQGDSKRTERIRFHGIDAPESHQAYGQASKKFVSDLIYDKDIRVEVQTRDKYGRLVGKVFVGDTHVNLEVVKAGYAWWYRQYGAGETALAEAEETARTARRGLWQDKNPVAPWDFRHKPELARQATEPALAASSADTPAKKAEADAKRYWVTSSSGKTHNATCRWYANSNGYYSATGTGNNCMKCGGSGYDNSTTVTAPTVSANTPAAAPSEESATDSKRYWVTSSSGKTHNRSCRWYANSRGYYSATGTGNNCMKCGGSGYDDSTTVTAPTVSANTPAAAPSEESATDSKRYWVTSSSGKTHNRSCRWYANSRGYYSAKGTGNNCKVCGGAN